MTMTLFRLYLYEDNIKLTIKHTKGLTNVYANRFAKETGGFNLVFIKRQHFRSQCLPR